MEYFWRLTARSFSEAWDLVFDRRVLSAVIAAAIFASTLFYRWRRRETITERLKDTGVASLFTGAAFLIIFLFQFLVLTPKALVQESEAAKKKAEASLQKLDVADHSGDVALKQRAITLAAQIREFIQDWKDSDDEQLQSKNVGNYFVRFSHRAVQVRDDLAQHGQQSAELDKLMYDFSPSYKDVRAIPVELEKLANTTSVPLRFEITEKDQQARKEINTLKKQLDNANETIQKLDPLRQPISGVSAYAQVMIKQDQKNLNVRNMALGAKVAVARESEALLVLTVGESYQKTASPGIVAFIAVFNMPPYGPLLGQPIKELSTAEYIQLEFDGADMPENASVAGGQVVFTINGNQRFELNVTEQTADGRKIFIRDVSPMREKLNAAKPPLPTPNMEASPHSPTS